MATKKQPTKNTSAPKEPGNSADVSPEGISFGASATEAAQAASQANQPAAGQPTSEIKVASTEGDTGLAEVADFTQAPEGAPLEAIAIQSLLVTSQVDGFRRAGRAWSRTPTLVLAEDLSEAEIEALCREPQLKVVFVGNPAEKIAG